MLHALPFLSRPALIGGDEPHYALMAYSLAVDRDIDLENNYRQVEAGSLAAGRKAAGKPADRHTREFHDRSVFTHSFGLPLLAAPFVWVQQLVAPGAAPDWLLGGIGLALAFLALLEGVRLLEKLTGDPARAKLIGFAVYFCTPMWFYSRSFLTESYTWSLLVLSLGAVSRRRWILASFLLGSVFWLKETTVLLIVPILIWVWGEFGLRGLLQLSIWPAIFLALFCIKNQIVYGEWLVTFQPFQLGDPWWEGFGGLVLDHKSGLIPFAPITILAVLVWLARWPPGSSKRWANTIGVAIFVLYFVVSALWIDWRGGWCYGPRLMVPVLPVLALPLLTALDWARERRLIWYLFFGLSLVGFMVQWCAAVGPFNAFWSMPVFDLVASRHLAALSGLVLGSGLLLCYRFCPRGETP